MRVRSSWRVFVERSAFGRAACVLVVLMAAAGCAVAGRASLSSSGVYPDRDSAAPSVGDGAGVVVFESMATNLVPDDTNGFSDIFVRDALTKTTIRISEGPGGVEADGPSTSPVVSPDGQKVVFQSEATNLVPDDTNGAADVFVWDAESVEITRVSLTGTGVETDGPSTDADISDDGRFVVFTSNATNLVAGDTNGLADVFVRDRLLNSTVRQPLGVGDTEPDGESGHPAISGDGSGIVFESRATNLVNDDTNASADVFLWDMATSSSQRLSVAADQIEGNGDSRAPAINGNGSTVVFESDSTNFDSLDDNDATDVFVVDAGTPIQLVMPGSTLGDGDTEAPSISHDGQVVGFETDVTNWIDDDTNGLRDVYVFHRGDDRVVRVSDDYFFGQGNGASGDVSLDPSGEVAAYTTSSTNLGGADALGVDDIVIRSRREPEILSVSPSSLEPGQTATLSLTGVDFTDELRTTNLNSWITLHSFVAFDDATAEVQVMVDPDAPQGDYNIDLVASVLSGSSVIYGTRCSACLNVDRPVVDVAPSDHVAVEGANPTDDGAVTLTRTGPALTELTVDYSVSGTAGPDDHQLQSGSVSLPAGTSSIEIPISPVDDAENEEAETVVISLDPGIGYETGSADVATVVIVDNDLTITVALGTPLNDAAEGPRGDVDINDRSIFLGRHPDEGAQIVAHRFPDVAVPPGVTITDAWIQYQSADDDAIVTTLDIRAQAIDDAPPITTSDFDISSRTLTSTSVEWNPPSWSAAGLVGADQRTPGLSALVQAVVDTPGWASGNAMAFIIEGSGRREFVSRDLDPAAAPTLYVEYAGSGTPANTRPAVQAAGAAAAWPAPIELDGTVTDDLLPSEPGSLTTEWSLVSGPGQATFADPAAVDTVVTFSAPGEYELQLRADDGVLVTTDSIRVASVDASSPPPEVARIAAIGDLGAYGQGDLDVAALVSGLGFDAVVTSGDNRYINRYDDALGSNYSDYIGNYQGEYGPGSAVNRFFPTIGNHDYDPPTGIEEYFSYFDLPGSTVVSPNDPGNERYYDVVIGPVHFFMLNSDSREPDGRSSGSVQGQWLESALASSTAPWKVVIAHNPPYSSGPSQLGSTPTLQWPYELWGADAVIAGHRHHYERILKDGFPYFVVGTGGAPLSSVGAIEPDSEFVYDTDFGVLSIDACATRLSFEFISVSGGTLDTHSLGATSCSVTEP